VRGGGERSKEERARGSEGKREKKVREERGGGREWRGRKCTEIYMYTYIYIYTCMHVCMQVYMFACINI